jgi:hypothetical protein
MRNRALLVGLNAYPDPRNALRGCLNDVRQLHGTLKEHFGFGFPGDTRILTDARATTGAIRDGLAWLVGGAAAGDVLVFHYSGHGSQVPDRDGDEAADGLDEIICPYDLDWDDPFSDDDLHAIVKDIPAGVNLTVVLDCCHAGTGLRVSRPANAAAPNETRLSGPHPDAVKCLCPPVERPGPPRERHASLGLAGGAPQTARARVDRRLSRFGARAAADGAMLIAACRDDQVSADAFIQGDYHGALTFYLCQALAESAYSTTYSQLLRRVRHLLEEHGFEQVPQLDGPASAKRRAAFASLVPAFN